jgi:hypothetical protein
MPCPCGRDGRRDADQPSRRPRSPPPTVSTTQTALSISRPDKPGGLLRRRGGRKGSETRTPRGSGPARLQVAGRRAGPSSGSPSIRFRFCTAAPDAPLPRLSSTATSGPGFRPRGEDEQAHAVGAFSAWGSSLDVAGAGADWANSARTRPAGGLDEGLPGIGGRQRRAGRPARLAGSKLQRNLHQHALGVAADRGAKTGGDRGRYGPHLGRVLGSQAEAVARKASSVPTGPYRSRTRRSDPRRLSSRRRRSRSAGSGRIIPASTSGRTKSMKPVG